MAIHLRMTRVIIENMTGQDYISRYDRPETFFYLDPPYWDTEDFYGKNIFSRADYTQMAKTLATIQGKFLLSINDAPQIRTIFADFRVQEVKTTYICAKDGSTNAAELLIMNYEPKQGMLRLF